MWVPKLLLPPAKIKNFGQKMTNLDKKVCIFGLSDPFGGILVLTPKIIRRSGAKRLFLPQNMLSWTQLGLAGSFGVLLVGWLVVGGCGMRTRAVESDFKKSKSDAQVVLSRFYPIFLTGRKPLLLWSF